MTDVPIGLVTKLDEFVVSLREHDQEHWARWMELARTEIAAGDPHGVDRVLDAYGGMGSISDLPLPFDHGVMALRGEVYGLASMVRANRQARAADDRRRAVSGPSEGDRSCDAPTTGDNSIGS